MQKDSESKIGFLVGALGQRRSLVWALLFLFWFALGVFSAGAPFIELPQIRRPVPPSAGLSLMGRMFLTQFVIWLSWVALVPVVLWLRRRVPLERSALRWTLPVHLLSIALLCLVHAGLALLLTELINGYGPAPPITIGLAYLWTRDLAFCGLFYGLVLGIGSALNYYQQFRERELRAAQLETQLAQSQLQMLRMQLHPHFLFNTLNGITGLVRDRDNEAAVQMLVGLSDLLRQTLENSGQQEVPLREELEWLELYLKIQQMRFSDRLQIRLEARPEVAEALVPNLITQPLVENSIKHGLARRAEPGTVLIRAEDVNGHLELRVCDDGVGLPEGWQLDGSNGVGLTNTLARLRQLYGDDFKLELRNREQGGVEALLLIPLRKKSAPQNGHHDEQ